jgi:hypothetical protein
MTDLEKRIAKLEKQLDRHHTLCLMEACLLRAFIAMAHCHGETPDEYDKNIKHYNEIRDGLPESDPARTGTRLQ